MDVTHLIVAIIALSIGVLIGRNGIRKRENEKAIVGNPETLPRGNDGGQRNDKSEMSFGMRVFSAVFLFGWLTAWTAGIAMAVSNFSSTEGGASLFMVGWLIAAIAGWVWAVYTLWKLVTGRPVKLRGWN
ncbi:hypothetical protein [Ruegeria profundi]|uniref:Uncharacterized protein n=1 Tax=Ruegeria profundi TaxID=1685378 RepID=A0A0X3TR40_9RHOB|nr:hypothetical protein [Ruegeria profundi]KUJ78208.1 hypothetical protein AVO44_13690 [Ruegeria profundi]